MKEFQDAQHAPAVKSLVAVGFLAAAGERLKDRKHQTIPTLLFDSDAWETAMQLSFSFPSLMHAILCASARQLSFLFPDEQKYATAATTHLIKTLCLFRDDLSTKFTPSNADAFMVTTALLHMEMWSNVEFMVFGPDGAMLYDPLQDRLFQHSLGVLHVFLSCTPISLQESSPLMPHVKHSSRNVLVNAAKLSRKSLENFRWFFSYERPLSLSLLSVPLPFVRDSDLAPEDDWAVQVPKLAEIGPSESKEAGYSLKGYYGIVDRLCLILSFLPEAQDEEYEGLSPELTTNLSRYLIIFPVLCDQQLHTWCSWLAALRHRHQSRPRINMPGALQIKPFDAATFDRK
ncbi:hypothetical protein THAR02_10974 [Trichoderma harzianum]|uniref:Transcription factor domain-containing protein n=1 Tax=Trichoderma harzianum TaxID=5544 RepID=A0A0F9Z8K3_TRIHA|nr:hypothetical protein THAR02_10974 [Trichoderma harzianum]